MFKIKDNFLKKEDYLLLNNKLISNNFPWYLIKESTKESNEKNDFHFGHNFYINNQINSDYFNLINPLIELLDVKALIRIKANLYPISKNLFLPKKHVDQTFKCKVAIFYINTNNGYTMIENKKIESIENRIVFFESDKKHFGTNCTDTKCRLTLNFNYF